MSKQALRTVVQRSINDAQFRRQLAVDAGAALAGYDLTAEELGALRSRDAGKLTAFGIDTRMSKVFTMDQGAIGNASITIDQGALGNDVVITGEPRDVGPMWIGDGAAHGAVQSPDAADRNLAYTSLSESVATGAVQSPDAMDRNALLSSGAVEPRDTEPTWIGDSAAPAHTFSGDDNAGPEVHLTGDENADHLAGDGNLQQ